VQCSRHEARSAAIIIAVLIKDSVKKKMSSLTMPRLPSKAKFWKKRSSANITEYDPTFRVIYLGNVLTGWAKGDGCVDKPLATLWKNHTTTDKPNIVMKVTVCASGLKAVTKEHGLTEYWAHRITFCNAEPAYPKVFCWIYRHEGRKMKQELRCHAVLCPSENKARLMAKRLKERLHQALVDFKKEKVWRQNARLSLANAADEQKTMPFRKIMLQPGSSNYRPPLEKGKSAPKLKVIEEVIFEEDEEEEMSEESESDPDDPTHTPLEMLQKPQLQKLSSMLRAADSDTNHITRLRLDGGGSMHVGLLSNSHITSSDSLPLLAAAAQSASMAASEMSSRCSSSLSMDALSTMTAVTSFIDEDQDSRDTPGPTLMPNGLSSGLRSSSSEPENLGGMKLNVQNLIVISSDPSPEVDRKLRPRPSPARLLTNGFNRHISTTPQADDKTVTVSQSETFHENNRDGVKHLSSEKLHENNRDGATLHFHSNLLSRASEDSEEDEDQVTDYLEKLSVEVTSDECRAGLIDSETPRSEAATSNSEVSPRTETTDSDTPVSPLITTRLAIHEQDTISDESGYSEESSPSNKELGDLGGRDLNELEEEYEDNTVKGVLISDFSPSERLKYLQRSQSTSSRSRGQQPLSNHDTNGTQQLSQPPIAVHHATSTDFFQNKMPEFCIEI